MAEDLVYDACLEVQPNGECVAQLSDLPACFARAAGETQALSALESSIPAYFDWLARHDEYTPVMHAPFRAVAAETLRTPNATVGAFFQSDSQPLTADDLDWYATLLDWSYQDYEGLLTSAGAEEESATHTAEIALSEQQVWLLSRFERAPVDAALTLPQVSQPEPVAFVHRACLERVRAASHDDRSRVVDLEGEQWSLRKVLRRSILLVREAALELN